jgi:hypothetical protein
MNKTVLFVLLSVFSIASFEIAHSEPTPITAGMHQSVLADAHVIFGEDEENFLDIDFDEEFQVGTIDPMKVSAKAVSTDGKAQVRSFGRGSSKWQSLSAGSMRFHGGWITKNVTENGRASIRSPANGQPSWQYTFVPDVDSVFTLKWDIRGHGTNTEGLRGYELDVRFSPFHTMMVDTEGSVEVFLVAGTTYTISVRNLSETNPPFQFEGMPLGDRKAFITARFSWNIEPQ